MGVKEAMLGISEVCFCLCDSCVPSQIFVGAGFHTRNDEECMDDEVDIDGDDQAFGEAQFTEGDIVPVSRQEVDEDIDIDVEVDGSDDESPSEQRTLRDLVAAGKVLKQPTPSQIGPAQTHSEGTVMGVSDIDSMDLAIAVARRKEDKTNLIQALENKIKQLVRLICYRSRTPNLISL